MDPLPPVPYGTSMPHMIPPYTLLGGPENVKLLFDTIMGIQTQALLDNQANARAYNALTLRMANNAATLDQLGFTNAVISAQIGDTSGQQTTSPIRTGVGDTMAAASYPADRATDTADSSVAAGIAESVQTNVTTQVSALSEQILALGGTITTGLQAVADSNASIAASLATMAAALTVLAPKPSTGGTTA